MSTCATIGRSGIRDGRPSRAARRTPRLARSASLLLLLSALVLPRVLEAGSLDLGTAFTASGRLDDGGRPAEGLFDFELTLWDARSGGRSLGSIERPARPVEGGVFSEPLDFGPRIRQLDEAWIEVRVRETGDVEYTTLRPRQRVARSSACVVSEATIQGRLTAGTGVSHGAGALIHGPDSDRSQFRSAVVVRSGAGIATTDLYLDHDQIDAWGIGGGIPLVIGANSGAGVAIAADQATAMLQVGEGQGSHPISIGELDEHRVLLGVDEIAARNATGNPATLYLNHEGGDVVFHGGAGGAGKVVVPGVLDIPLQRLASGACSNGVVYSPACPANMVAFTGSCHLTTGQELRASFREGQGWTCVYTACGATVQAEVLCLGIE